MSDHTLLLLHGEEIVDASNNHVPLTNHGVTVSSAQSKFGGKSLYFNGQSKITFSLPNLSNLFHGDFTIDWWEYRQNNGISVMFDLLDSIGYSHLFLRFSGNQIFSSYGGGAWNAVNAAFLSLNPQNEWAHNAFIKSGDTLRMFVNGKLAWNGNVNSASYSGGNNTISIGDYLHVSGGLIGYIDEFRLSDIARWTSDFTPPDKPYTNTESQKENAVMIDGTIYKIEGGNTMINGAIRKVKRGNVLVSGTVRQIKLFASLFMVKVNFDPMANDIIIKTSINDDELVPFSMYSFGPGTNIIFTSRAPVGNDKVYLNGKLVGFIDDITIYVYDRGNDIKLEYGQRDTLHGLFIDER